MKSHLSCPVLNLAIPATIEHVLQTLVGFVDAFMIARIGLVAVTAVGIANSLLNVYLAIFIAIGVGASSLIAQKIGANKREHARVITNQSVVLSLISGIVFGLISIVFGKLLLVSMGAEQDTLLVATHYFYIVGGGAMFMALMTIFGSILRATADTKTPMKISIIVNVLNIALDYILIFGFGPIPALGVVGTALGTFISRMIGSYLLFKKVQTSKSPIHFPTLFSKSNYRHLVQLVIPATLERLVMRLGQVVYFSLIVAIGTNVFAAHSIAGSIESFTYMPAYGLSAAAATLVATNIGAKNVMLAKQYAVRCVQYGVLFMSLLGIVLFFGAPFFATTFTSDSTTIHHVVTALRIDAFAQPALAISLIATGALQGMGDTKTPLISTAVGMWGIRVAGVMVLSLTFNLGIAGVWLAIAIDLYVRSIFLVWKFRQTIDRLKH